MRERLVREDLADELAGALAKQLNPSILGYVILITAGLVAPRLAVPGFLLIALFLILPFQLFRRTKSQPRAGAEQ